MNDTMTCKFCTLTEAAEQLDTTQEQIENLLRRAILREFRDGTHRLLRAADVAAIAAAKGRRIERQGQSHAQTAAPSSSHGDESRTPHGQSGPARTPRSTVSFSRPAQYDGVRPKTTGAGRKSRGFAAEIPPREPTSPRSVGWSTSSRKTRAARSRVKRESSPVQPSPSIREWFWTGLTQDRPMTIALLSGLILLAISAVVVGAYILIDSL